MAPPCAGKMNQHTMASSKTNAAFGHTMVAWLAVASARNPTCREMRDDWF